MEVAIYDLATGTIKGFRTCTPASVDSQAGEGEGVIECTQAIRSAAVVLAGAGAAAPYRVDVSNPDSPAIVPA